jgi:hypothetical protein
VFLSGFFTKGEFYLHMIKMWKDNLLTDLLPRAFRVISLQIAASYNCCKQIDKVPQEPSEPGDLFSRLLDSGISNGLRGCCH